MGAGALGAGMGALALWLGAMGVNAEQFGNGSDCANWGTNGVAEGVIVE